MLTLDQFFSFFGEKDAFALARPVWLDYVDCIYFLTEGHQLERVLRQAKGFGRELELVRELFRDVFKIHGQFVLSGDLTHADEMVDLLPKLHILKLELVNRLVCPLDQPVVRFFLCD